MQDTSAAAQQSQSATNSRSVFSAIKPFQPKGNIAVAWREWKTKFEIFLCATNLENESDTRKNALLLHHIGEEANSVYYSFNISHKEIKHDALIKKFDDFYSPKRNVDISIYKLITRKQAADESIETYVTKLKNLATNCELKEQNDKIVKLVFVAGLLPQHDAIRVQLLMKESDEAVLFAQTMHASQLQSKSKEEPAENQLVNKVERGRSSNFRGRGRRGRTSAICDEPTSSNFTHNPQHGRQSSFGKQKPCKSCGNSIHYSGKCPAIGRNCSVCGKPNHLRGYATSERSGLWRINSPAMKTTTNRQMMMDLTSSLVLLMGFKMNNGFKSCKELGILKQVNTITAKYTSLIKKYEVFQGVGCVKDTKCKITIKENAKPVAEPARRIPYMLRRRVRGELNRMVKLGIIEPVNEPTEWVNPIVTVTKGNGELRVCLDPHFLNKEIITPKHYIPTVDDIKAKLKGATVFTTLDAKAGFWALPLDEESSKLTTFATPFGGFKFKRLAYGLNCTSEIFQAEMCRYPKSDNLH
nr:PREDICTED: uncharacterized protein K02A2.6-like [Bemisia tabaci]